MLAEAVASEQTLTLSDGAEIFYRAWHPDTASDRALLVFHRGHEHSGRMRELIETLDLAGFHCFAWDARGHGRSSGARGYAENAGVLVRDVDEFVRAVSKRHEIPIENMAVLAHSVGAAIVAAWVHDYAPPIRAMVLATPAFRVKLYIPFALPALRLRQRLFGKGVVKSYVKARMLTHDREQAAAYQADPLVFREIADNILVDLFDTSTRVVEDAGAIRVPTLLLVADSDWVVRVSAQERFFARLSSPVKRIVRYPGFYHAIFHERERRLPIAASKEFIGEMFAKRTVLPSLLDADRQGPTRAECDRLARRSPNPLWTLQRLVLRTIGKLSRGIRLGWDVGFDSGVTLDYVYANRAQGTTPLGRWIDRSYLDSLGWKGIRRRREHLQDVLRESIEELHAAGSPVRILDIAAGPGRYVLETMRQLPGISITALLRDYQDRNLEAGRTLAREFGITGVEFRQGDAFDRRGLAALSPPPTISIVTGLYELYPENAPVLESLRGLAEAMRGGGRLIYTNQPWHPQIEFIARVLRNREGKPWVMRRRTQDEMDELVRAAGFAKLGMKIDPWGIFSVSWAERRA